MKKISILFLPLVVFAALLWSPLGNQANHLEWMQRQIKEDLSLYSKEDLNPSRLASSYHYLPKEEKLVYFQIKNNQIYWKSKSYLEAKESIESAAEMLYKASKKHRFPDVDFILSLENPPSEAQKSQKPEYLPLFVYLKEEGQGGLLLPDPMTEAFVSLHRKKVQAAKLHPKNYWRNKKESLFWRGEAKGDLFSKGSWHEDPRARLALLSQYYPEEVDASFSSLPGLSEYTIKEIQPCLPLKGEISRLQRLNYKYLAVSDVEGVSWPHFCFALCSGSVAFKPKSPQIQWYSKALKEGEHYILVESDFSDVPEKVKWAKAHDREVKAMAKKAGSFVQSHLLLKSIYSYIAELLDEYAKLQDTKTSLLSDVNLYKGCQKTKGGKT